MSQEHMAHCMESIRQEVWSQQSNLKKLTGIKLAKAKAKYNDYFALMQTCEEIYNSGDIDAEERIKSLKMTIFDQYNK